MPTQTIEVLRIPGTLFPRGAFDENADYKFLNFVESGGNGYVCLQPCTGIPVTNTAYWFKFVFKGDKGDAFTYADLTAEQKAELVRDATAAAQAAASSAQSAADDAAAALQKFNTIKAAIDAIDPTSTEGSIQTLAAKQGLLESELDALGPKIDQLGEIAPDSNYTRAYTDSHGRVLWGIKTDGSIEWAIGIPTPVAEELAALDALIVGKVDKVQGKSLIDSIYASGVSTENDSIFAYAITDTYGRVIFGIKKDGTIYPEQESASDENFAAFLTKWKQANEKVLITKLADVGFAKSDFGNYNIAQNGNIYASTGVLSTQGFYELQSRKLSFSINAGYRAILSFYTSNHTMVIKTTPELANAGIYVVDEPSATCFRISIKKTYNGTITTDDYDVAELRLAYMQESPEEDYEIRRILLPIYPPVPQKPADGTEGSNFNAETVTASDILSACDSAIQGNTRYASSSILGKDSSGEYDIKVYTLTRRNRFAYRAASALYAWKNGNTIVYIESCSPVVGATIYDSSHASIGKTIASFNSATDTITDSANATYTRSASDNIAADIFWARYISDNILASVMYAYSREGTFLWQELGDFRGDVNVVHGGKTYVRSPEYDFHSDTLYNIVIWGNEHGPQSDPMEPSIIICRMIEDLVGANGKTNKMLSFIRNYCKVSFVPCANPYGCDHHTRNNYNDVNINRNYPTAEWANATEKKGAYAGSERETQIVMNLVMDMRADIAIDSHCLGYVSDGGTEANTGKLVMESPYADRLYLDRISSVTESEYGLSVSEFDNDTAGLAQAWLYENSIVGGVSEMNAGRYGGIIHSANILEADYFYFLNVLRMFLNSFDKDFRLDDFRTELL